MELQVMGVVVGVGTQIDGLLVWWKTATNDERVLWLRIIDAGVLGGTSRICGGRWSWLL